MRYLHAFIQVFYQEIYYVLFSKVLHVIRLRNPAIIFPGIISQFSTGIQKSFQKCFHKLIQWLLQKIFHFFISFRNSYRCFFWKCTRNLLRNYSNDVNENSHKSLSDRRMWTSARSHPENHEFLQRYLLDFIQRFLQDFFLIFCRVFPQMFLRHYLSE